MSAWPVQLDIYGMAHPYGCPSNITVRKAFLKPEHVYVTCADCRAIALLPDIGTDVGTNADTDQ